MTTTPPLNQQPKNSSCKVKTPVPCLNCSAGGTVDSKYGQTRKSRQRIPSRTAGATKLSESLARSWWVFDLIRCCPATLRKGRGVSFYGLNRADKWHGHTTLETWPVRLRAFLALAVRHCSPSLPREMDRSLHYRTERKNVSPTSAGCNFPFLLSI